MTDQDPTQPFEPPRPDAVEPASAQPAPAMPQPEPAVPAAPPPPVFPGAPPSAGVDVPVAPVGRKPGGRSPLRWIVALLVVALVVAGGIGATLLLTSSTGGTSAVVGYAPADTLTYAEARLDLPGSQRAEVAKTLAAFPGFADQAALNAKLGELFDRVIKAATTNQHDYQTEIAPWFGGQLAVAQGPSGLGASVAGLASPAPSPTSGPTASLPPCSGGAVATPAPSGDLRIGGLGVNVRALFLASVTDTAKAEAWVGSVLAGADSSLKTTDLTCDGVVVHRIAAAGSSGVASVDAGWAILGGKVLVGGDLDSIRLAIATKGTGGLNTTPAFQKAVAALTGDHLGFVYEAVRAQLQAQVGSLAALDTDGTLTALYNVVLGWTPEWMAGDLKAADGNFVMDSAQPAGGLGSSTNRASDLAALAPAKTVALSDVRDLGKTLGDIRAKLAADPKLAMYVKQFDDIVGLAGGFDGTVGWIGDGGFALTLNGSTVSGGILIRPEDGGAASRLFTQLRSLIQLAGIGGGIAISDEPYNGATITTVDLSALSPLLQQQLGSSIPGLSLTPDMKFVYAVTDKVVVLTLDTGFAKAAIDASQGGDSLAKDARFSALLKQAGEKNTGLTWVDLAAVRGLVEANLPADARTRYEADIRAYLLPIDALLSVGTADAGLQRGTVILSIKH